MTETSTVGRQQLILDPEEIASEPRQMLQPGVDYTMLWREDRSVAGLMFIAPGASMAEHTHSAATHHIWVVAGAAHVEGRTLRAGSYWHVPVGVPHAVEAARPDGCTLFYLYLRQPTST